MKHLKKFLADLEKEQLKTNITAAGTRTIQQTIRNLRRKEMMDAIYKDLIADGIDVFQTNDGLVLTAYNSSISNFIKDETSDTGYRELPIALQLTNTIKALDYDVEYEAEEYEIEQEEKAEKAKEQEQAKKEKIARDTLIRERQELERLALEAQLKSEDRK